MITERDLEQAIAECQGERNPNAHTCIKLAAYYTIKNELFGKSNQAPESGYSYASAEPVDTHTIDYKSDTDFSQMLYGKNPDDIWPIMDELMSSIQVLVPRLYDGVMRKLKN